MGEWRIAGGGLAILLLCAGTAVAASPAPAGPPASAPASAPESAPASAPGAAPASAPAASLARAPESAPAPALEHGSGGEGDLGAVLLGEDEGGATAATRFPAPRADAPSTITVLGREELQLHGFATLGEALSFLPGLFVEADPRRLHLVSRGLPDSMLLVFDSVPLISDAARLDVPLEDELDLDKVARIEIVRGPGSAAWGRNAFGGVVSLVPLTGADVGGASAALRVGSFATRHVSLLAGDRFGELDLFGAVSYRTTREPTVLYRGAPTFYVFPAGMGGVRIPAGLAARYGENAPDAALEAYARAGWRGLSVSARWADHADAGQLSSFSHAVLPRDANELRAGRSLLLRATYEQPLGPHADLTALLYGTWRSVREVERLFPFAPTGTMFGGAVDASGTALAAGAHLVLDWRPLSWLAGTAGLQADLAQTRLAAAYTDPATGEVTESGVTREASSTAATAWALARLTPGGPFGGALTLWAGLGLDLHTDFAPAPNPRFAAVLRPGGGFTVRASYGEADRTPDQFDLVGLAASAFADGGVGGAEANPALRPERLRTGELAAEWTIPGLVRVEATAFVTHARGLVVREIDPVADALFARNDGSRLLYGGEAAARAELVGGRLLLGAAYGLVLGNDRGRDPDAPDAVTLARDAPVHEGTATLGLRPIPALTMTLDAGVIGPRPLRDGSGAVLPAEATLDLNAVLRVPAAHLFLELRARNVTSTATFSRNEGVANRSPTVNLPGAPASVLLTVGGEI
ncbi:MAG TPA: TonB-dependent receptor [Myxococcota bacterium]|nr:TonB-dependent receptor [Myxococcota bacterium]